MPEAKPYVIPKQIVWNAYKKVKANRGAAGVDGQSLAEFEKDFCGARDLKVSKSLNPELQSFSAWLSANKDRIPLG